MTVVYDMPSEPRPWVCDRTGQPWYGDSDGWRRGGHTDDQPVPWRTLLAEHGPLEERPSDEEAREYAIRVLAWAAERMLASAETWRLTAAGRAVLAQHGGAAPILGLIGEADMDASQAGASEEEIAAAIDAAEEVQV